MKKVTKKEAAKALASLLNMYLIDKQASLLTEFIQQQPDDPESEKTLQEWMYLYASVTTSDIKRWNWESKIGLLRYVANRMNGNYPAHYVIRWNGEKFYSTFAAFADDFTDGEIRYASDEIANKVIALFGGELLKEIYQIKEV